ncbi:MAG: glycosyl transferase family 39, partial [Desulfurococcaceae archaeon]
LYIYPDGKVLYAEGFYPLWLASLILLVFYLPAVFTGFKEYGYVALFYAGVLGSYVLLWILGSRTQYSFYGVQLAPLVYMNLVFVTYLALTREEFTQRAARAWNALVLKLIGILLE